MAPRASACSSASRTIEAAPSAKTKPLRRVSNGREASSGRSLKSLVSAWRLPNAAIVFMSITASDPPAIATSISSQAMCLAARPMASEPVAQALETLITGPQTPVICAILPAVALDMTL